MAPALSRRHPSSGFSASRSLKRSGPSTVVGSMMVDGGTPSDWPTVPKVPTLRSCRPSELCPISCEVRFTAL